MPARQSEYAHIGRAGAQYEKRSWCGADVVQVVCGLCIDYSTLLIGVRRFAVKISFVVRLIFNQSSLVTQLYWYGWYTTDW